MTKFWHFIKKIFFSKFSKFSSNAVINYILRLGLVFVLTEVFHIWYFISYVITLTVVVTFSFFFNVYITFEAKAEKKKTFLKYLGALILFAGLDAMLVKLLTEALCIYYLISINLVMIVLFVLKFLFYQKYVFIAEIKE